MRIFNDFNSIQIRLASPEKIRDWSYGEVKKPETINYRTLKPERDGLFCEKIFGTTKEWECYCGKFKSIRYKGVVCDRCGVEVTHYKVRRERMGHIELAAPVSHIWYYRSVPSRMGLLLDLTVNELKSILYFEKYVIIDPADSGREVGEQIDDEEYHEMLEEYGDKFQAALGAEAIKELLARLDCGGVARQLRQKLDNKIRVTDKRILKRIEVLEAFHGSTNKPEWMVLDVVPIIPPELRPMVQLDGGRFATSDLNDLYRRVINRNNRLKRLLALKAPEIIVRNEKRMLQEAVDALFDNSRRKRAVKGKGNRPLKSISDMLKGKTGRFRQNLLGKRVDYSGRSVIVAGPELSFYEMGLPKKMALELFKPFIMRVLVNKGYVYNIKSAKKMVEAEEREVFEALEEVVHEHPVLLNRAPTLHRLGIQGFLPRLVDGKAIKLHPLVCHAFNADFDGDQMAIHVPLSPKAQLECWTLMLSPHNLLNPANGEPVVSPTQDIVLGIYYLTSERNGETGEGKTFASLHEIEYAVDKGVVSILAKVNVLLEGRLIETTPGRMIFNSQLPEGYRFINRPVGDKDMNKIIGEIYSKYGSAETVELLDRVKSLGYKYGTKFGPTISITDILIPEQKKELIKAARATIEKIEEEQKKGIITNEERYKKVVAVWTEANEKITDVMYKELENDKGGFNPVFLMARSGARGSKQQIRQLAGMRGLMAKPSGDIIEMAIQSNFREGLNVLEFFISTHGARKGLADTALKTADAGYLTRRLVDIAQDVIVNEIDCGTKNSIILKPIKEGGKVIDPLRDKLYGRYLAQDILDASNENVVYERNTLVDTDKALHIENLGYEEVAVRSVLTCETRYGVCSHCYGTDLARLKPVQLGEAVGIIAAQSIGQPGTQLTMRTFHIGGAAFTRVVDDFHKAPYDCIIHNIAGNIITTDDGRRVNTRRGTITLMKVFQTIKVKDITNNRMEDGQRVVKGEVLANQADGKPLHSVEPGVVKFADDLIYILGEEYVIPTKVGSALHIETGQVVAAGTVLCKFDPYNELAVAEFGGSLVFEDLVFGKNVKIDEEDKSSKKDDEEEEKGIINYRVIEVRGEKLVPKIVLQGKGGARKEYLVPNGALLTVRDQDTVLAGDILFKLQAQAEKTRDITGGLPRVEELFEARKPGDGCFLAELDGRIEDKGDVAKEKRIIYLHPESDELDKVKYAIPFERQILVQDGDYVRQGDQITDGTLNPHDILRVQGINALNEYLVREVQEVYRLQGVDIADKHIETICRQMLRRIEITDPGDTSFIMHQHVDKFMFMDENKRVEEEGGSPAEYQPILLGITRASLTTESFISAASFQETTKVLTDAAIKGKVDELIGLKENVIIGHLIPAGTGLKHYHHIEVYKEEEGDLEYEEEEVVEEQVPEAEKAVSGARSAGAEAFQSVFKKEEDIDFSRDDDDDDSDLGEALPTDGQEVVRRTTSDELEDSESGFSEEKTSDDDDDDDDDYGDDDDYSDDDSDLSDGDADY